MKKLGFGLMRLPLLDKDNPASIDIDTMCKMVDSFLEQGFTYFDTAWMYCGFQSENAVKTALCDRHPRESFTLADKLHAAFLENREDRDRIFNTQLEKTGAGYFDYYLIHDVRGDHYKIFEELGCFEWLADKKAKGLVKKIGFSFHDNAEFLERVLSEHPEVDFVQLQINYLDWESDSVQSRLCYETARKHGKPIVVMEPVKGGTLADVPAAVSDMFKDYNPDMSVASWAIRFAASLEGVFMVLSGMSNMQQLLDNTAFMSDFVPLSSEEIALTSRAAAIINAKTAINCTGCSYCVDGCPKNIAIPTCFSLYNADLREKEDKPWLPQESYYEGLATRHGVASDCIACRKCESVCPQQLPIVELLKTVREHFGK